MFITKNRHRTLFILVHNVFEFYRRKSGGKYKKCSLSSDIIIFRTRHKDRFRVKDDGKRMIECRKEPNSYVPNVYYLPGRTKGGRELTESELRSLLGRIYRSKKYQERIRPRLKKALKRACDLRLGKGKWRLFL